MRVAVGLSPVQSPSLSPNSSERRSAEAQSDDSSDDSSENGNDNANKEDDDASGSGSGSGKASANSGGGSKKKKTSLLTRLRGKKDPAKAERQRVRELSQAVNKAFVAKKYDQALEVLWEMLKSPAIGPIQDRVYFNVTLCQSALGNTAAALMSLETALQAGYSNWGNIQVRCYCSAAALSLAH